MKNKDKITIVSPVYNTPAKYLNKFIESVYSQTYDNIELILVDDGSEQPTVDYLHLLDKKYEELKILYHSVNKGGSEARKTGYRTVTGAEYLMECDPDDYMPLTAVETLYNLAKKYDADVVVGGAQTVLGPFKLPYTPEPDMAEEKFFSRDEIVNDLLISFFGDDKIPVAQWGKIYHKKFLPVLSECEIITDFAAGDETVVLNIFSQANSVVVTPEVVYYYRKGGGSSQFREKYFEDVLNFYNYRKPFIDKYLSGYEADGKTARDLMDIELKNETHFVLYKYASANKPTHEALVKMVKTVLSAEEVKNVFNNKELKSIHAGYDEAVLSGDCERVASFIENEVRSRPLSDKLKTFLLKLF